MPFFDSHRLGQKHWQTHVVALTSSDDNKNKA